MLDTKKNCLDIFCGKLNLKLGTNHGVIKIWSLYPGQKWSTPANTKKAELVQKLLKKSTVSTKFFEFVSEFKKIQRIVSEVMKIQRIALGREICFFHKKGYNKTVYLIRVSLR